MRDITTLTVYLHELNQQVNSYVDDLNGLSGLEQFNNLQYYAAERLLQVLIEACIGISKHWLKFLNKTVPNDAYKSFELLVQYNLLPAADLILWRKIIGLRNALVHDYLNLDKTIIFNIVHEKQYLFLASFIKTSTHHIKQQL